MLADKAVREYQNTPLGQIETLANKGKNKISKVLSRFTKKKNKTTIKEWEKPRTYIPKQHRGK